MQRPSGRDRATVDGDLAREQDVLTPLADGLRNTEIAEGAVPVETHRRAPRPAVLDKLGVPDRQAAGRYAGARAWPRGEQAERTAAGTEFTVRRPGHQT
ncbi:hypothetical protein ACFZBP_07535 [Streptomyces sp. NPDC008086]|uniref:hypothetical protein n=1 Tax=Streptomyces sp. NPDC008086 TaxID=3364807 RepID=UPI0036E44C90